MFVVTFSSDSVINPQNNKIMKTKFSSFIRPARLVAALTLAAATSQPQPRMQPR